MKHQGEKHAAVVVFSYFFSGSWYLDSCSSFWLTKAPFLSILKASASGAAFAASHFAHKIRRHAPLRPAWVTFFRSMAIWFRALKNTQIHKVWVCNMFAYYCIIIILILIIIGIRLKTSFQNLNGNEYAQHRQAWNCIIKRCVAWSICYSVSAWKLRMYLPQLSFEQWQHLCDLCFPNSTEGMEQSPKGLCLTRNVCWSRSKWNGKEQSRC